MNTIKEILMEQEIYKTYEEVDTYLQEKDATKSTHIQTLIFDKSVFETQSEVLDWVTSHGFISEKEIDETEDSFRVRQLDPSEFNADSFRTIEIRRGIKAVVGQLRREELTDYYLSLRNDDSYKFVEGLPHIIELAKVIEGTHVQYGPVKITEKDLESFVKNFNEKTLGIEPMVDFDHETREAAGWIKSVFLDYDKQVLFGEIKWTPKGALALQDKAYRYFSPEFSLNYVHPHTGVAHGPTLMGGALVNRPFLKMDAIVELNNKQEKETVMDTISLKEHNDKIKELDLKLKEANLAESTAQKSIKGLKDENKKLSEELKTIKADNEKKKREAVNKKLFDEGKINKAQLDALNDGKGMFEVLALAETMNMEAKGKSGNNKESIKLSEDEEAICAKLGLTHEEFLKYNEEN